jgi:nucleotide-binding universal stress UspA family protein
MKVLVGIDGTARSFHALEYASRMLSGDWDCVALFFSPPEFHCKANREVSSALSELARETVAEAVFSRATRMLPEPLQRTVSTIVGPVGNPAQGILDAAEGVGAELVVLGSHNSSNWSLFLLGDTARKVTHRSACPVLLVRDKQEISDSMKVLIACDEDEQWRGASRVLDNFTWPADTEANLYHVVSMMADEEVQRIRRYIPTGDLCSRKLLEDYRAQSEEQEKIYLARLAEGRDHLPKLVQNAEAEVVCGSPVENIVKKVTENDIDLVVVCARKLSLIGRLVGSTTEGLLNHCPCSLLVLHQQTAAVEETVAAR